VPLLADVLAVCDGMVVNVEIKNDPRDPGYDPTEAVAALTAAAIDEAGWTTRVIVSSFQVSTLRAVQAADGRLALGALWPVAGSHADALAQAVEAGWKAVHPFVVGVNPELVEQAHRAGLEVNVWTVNAPEDIAACIRMGVDAVITDRLVEALASARSAGAGG
jgi:glycerophosphoryl diester phosphodiesterase